jgi:hypothetical protein
MCHATHPQGTQNIGRLDFIIGHGGMNICGLARAHSLRRSRFPLPLLCRIKQ